MYGVSGACRGDSKAEFGIDGVGGTSSGSSLSADRTISLFDEAADCDLLRPNSLVILLPKLEPELGIGGVGETVRTSDGRPSGPKGIWLTIGGGAFAVYDPLCGRGALLCRTLTSSAVAKRCRPGFGAITFLLSCVKESGALSALSRKAGGGFGENEGIGGTTSTLGFRSPEILPAEGRLLSGADGGRVALVSQGDDFERCLELIVDWVLLRDEVPGICLDDLVLSAGDGFLLLDVLDLVGVFEDFPLDLGLPVGKGGKAQSRFVSSGDGGPCCIAIAVFRGAFHGDLRAEVALTGEPIDPLLLLAGVSSPASGLDTGPC